MNVELRLFATFRERVGERTLHRTVDAGTTVRELLAALEADYPDLAGELLDGDGETPASVAVLHEGKRANLDAELAAGDRVSVCPPVTGGSESGAENGTESGSRSGSDLLRRQGGETRRASPRNDSIQW